MTDKPELKRFIRLKFEEGGGLIFYADQYGPTRTRYRAEPSVNVAIVERMVKDLYETAEDIGPGVWKSNRKKA